MGSVGQNSPPEAENALKALTYSISESEKDHLLSRKQHNVYTVPSPLQRKANLAKKQLQALCWQKKESSGRFQARWFVSGRARERCTFPLHSVNAEHSLGPAPRVVPASSTTTPQVKANSTQNSLL